MFSWTSAGNRNITKKHGLTRIKSCFFYDIDYQPQAEKGAENMAAVIVGWGIVQLGMSVQSHDATQRTQGVLCLFGGLLIAFAKEILTAIGVV